MIFVSPGSDPAGKKGLKSAIEIFEEIVERGFLVSKYR
jgi:hypothetical protein